MEVHMGITSVAAAAAAAAAAVLVNCYKQLETRNVQVQHLPLFTWKALLGI
jgi:cobalamin biosynthesis protein CbiD